MIVLIKNSDALGDFGVTVPPGVDHYIDAPPIGFPPIEVGGELRVNSICFSSEATDGEHVGIGGIGGFCQTPTVVGTKAGPAIRGVEGEATVETRLAKAFDGKEVSRPINIHPPGKAG